MKELYNIPCLDWIPFISAPLIDDKTSLPNTKKEKKLNISVVKERKNNYYELNIQHTLLNEIPLPSAPLIDDRASFLKSKKITNFE